MRILLIIIFTIIATLSYSQLDIDWQKKKKQYLVQGSLALVSGAADGVREITQFKYQKFKTVHPSANELFWNPQVSWKNKWKNGDINQGEKFPFSSTVLVATTDAYHALRTIDRSMLYGAIIVNLGQKQKWYWYFIDFVFITLTRNIGFNATYRFIYKGDSP